MIKLSKYFLLMVLAFNLQTVVNASTLSVEVEQHVIYTQSLNSMASKLMSWYGSLIMPTRDIRFQPIDKSWQIYRNKYPKNISEIEIIKTDLQRSSSVEGNYTFKVSTAVSHSNGEQVVQKYLDEQFEFNILMNNVAVIMSVNSNSSETIELGNKNISSQTFDGLHFKSREFAYAWLAYLDGAETASTIVRPEKANYEIQVGSININKPLLMALQERKQFLAKGGHTLRALELIEVADRPHSYQLDLTMTWKGVNSKNKAVIAKINQKIELKTMADGRWGIISIKEKHLLPDLTPWQDLLC